MAGTSGTSGGGVRGGGGSSRRASGSRTAAPEGAGTASVRTFPDRGESGDGLTAHPGQDPGQEGYHHHGHQSGDQW